jgi:competence protein ComGC
MNQPPPYPMTAQPKNSGLAISSLVLGILSLMCFYIFAAVPAVICGHIAYSRIKRSGGMLTGSGLALAGLITGYIGIAISLFMIPFLLAIAIPNFVKARDTAQKNACINHLQQISGAKRSWAMENKKDDADIPTTQDLSPYLKSGSLICPAGGVYSINSIAQKPTCSIQGHELPD